MNLHDYLNKNDLCRAEFGNMIRYDRCTIQKIIYGHTKPGKKLIQSIIEATDGEVTEEEILQPYIEKKNSESINKKLLQ